MFDARRLRVALAMLLVASGPGPAHPQAPASLEDTRKLLREARYPEAETSARTLLAEAEAASGPDSIQAALVVDVLVEALWRGGKVRAAETKALAERSVALKEQLLGSRHPDVGSSLATLGLVLRLRGDYPGAKALFERALTIQEQALEPGHPDVARTLTLSAGLRADTGDLAGAQALHERALAIRQQALPAGDPALAENLNGLGVVLEKRGDHAGAQRYHERALEIRESALGPAHPDVAASLNNLANVRSDTGDYAAARSLHERALAIRERALGPDHPDVAMSLNNLAIAVRDLGDHGAAWWLLERVLGIWERAFGPEHPNVAFASHNLSTILVDLGDEPGGRLLAERARRFRDRTGEGRFLTESLNGLVGVDPPSSGYQGARALLEHALTIKEGALGPGHTSVALTLTTLANLLTKLGQPDRARPLYERALAIREKALGPEHPDVADTMDRLGELLVEIGDPGAAKPIYEKVLAIQEQVYGPDHPHAGVARQHLAEVLAALGDVPGALRMALEAERVGREHLRLIGRTVPEREALMYAAMRPAGLDVALTLLARSEGRPSASTAAVWDAVVRSRAVVLDEVASRHRTVGAADDPTVAGLVRDLAVKRDQLARLAVRGPAGSGEQYRIELARARDERDAAERALAEQSLTFRQEQLQRHLGFEDVRAALPPRSALVAFVRYLQHQFGAQGEGSRPPPAEAYLAFVLRAGDRHDPALVALGAAADLDAEIARWRRQVTALTMAGGRSTARAEAALRPSGLRLRARLWDSLAAELAGASRVYIVPDGPLHLLNWEALPAGDGYLIEQAPLLHYLSAERDLVTGERDGLGQGLLIVDSPVFSERFTPAARVGTTGVGATVSATPAHDGDVYRGSRSSCGDFQSMRFDPLPASGREAETIASIWRRSHDRAAPELAAQSVSLPTSSPAASRAHELLRLSGPAATEAAVKQRAAGSRVLHLATHGFFLGGRCASALDRGAGTRGGEFAAGSDVGENPLLLAGFALTGANRRESAGPDDEDGILTAEEIAALDLRGVEWAVLSACDTGVGEVRAGEGVFGLRRAFQIAGARTVIMSLWPVDDEDARRWMTGVYERRFARGAGTMEAVRESSLEQLRRRRRAGLSAHPFYWGGFIAVGDWR